MKTLIYFHDKCLDGSAAAWVLLKALPDAIAKPARFGDPPPLDEALGFDRVIFADVCYEGEYLEEVRRYQIPEAYELRDVVVLDHHATSEKMVSGSKWNINQSMSGAGLALDWVRRLPMGPPWRPHGPWDMVSSLVAYVQDRDLWQWKLPKSKEVSAYLKASVQTFADLDDAATLLINDFEGLAAMGGVLLKDEQRRIAEAAERVIVTSFPEAPEGFIAFVNADPAIRSELGDYIRERWLAEWLAESFVVVWSVQANGLVRCSARGPGARQWAEKHGGGGHDSAAGCEITLGDMVGYLR